MERQTDRHTQMTFLKIGLYKNKHDHIKETYIN